MQAGWLHPAPVWMGDISDFDARPFRGRVHLVTSGDPCQPNSVAGKRLGEGDDRWLLDHVIRVVEECRPDRFFRENVAGNSDGQLRVLIPALEGMGYRVAAGIFSARGVGASHERKRLFIMADAARRSVELGNPDGRLRDGDAGASGRKPGRRIASDGAGGGAEPVVRTGVGLADASGLADACRPRLEGQQFGGACGDGPRIGAYGPACKCGDPWLPPLAPGPDDPRWPAILAGAPRLEPSIRRVADGMAHRVERVRAGGNGVVSLAAADAWLALDAGLGGDAAARFAAFMSKRQEMTA